MSAPDGIVWELRRRNRWGFAALGGYLGVLAAIKVSALWSGHGTGAETPTTFALSVIVPLTAAFVYLLAVFTYGLSGDLAARQSMYPARTFTLPVSTTALAGWPMTLGTCAMLALWLGIRALAAWPAAFRVPILWPGILGAVLLAWTQALTWMPYPMRGVRVIVSVLWLAAVDTIVLLALHFKAPEGVMLAILLPQLPLAYGVARVALALGRQGRGTGDAGRAHRKAESRTRNAKHEGDPFRSADSAQLWFEWRRHGRTLPALVAILLPFELAILFAARDAPPAILAILVCVLITPPFMAGFAAATVRDGNSTHDGYGLSPFIATRPLTSSALVAAKARMSIASTLVTWALVLVAIPAGLALSDTWGSVVAQWQHAVAYMGTPRAIVLVILVVASCMLWTWKQLVQTLYVGLAGRAWLVKTRVFGTLVVLSLLGPALGGIARSNALQAAIWDSLVWLPAVLVALKMAAAGWVFTKLYDARVLDDRTLVLLATTWCVAVLALYAVLSWFVDTDLVPHHVLALGAILVIPLARIPAAPLALAWNRHR